MKKYIYYNVMHKQSIKVKWHIKKPKYQHGDIIFIKVRTIDPIAKKRYSTYKEIKIISLYKNIIKIEGV